MLYLLFLAQFWVRIGTKDQNPATTRSAHPNPCDWAGEAVSGSWKQAQDDQDKQLIFSRIHNVRWFKRSIWINKRRSIWINRSKIPTQSEYLRLRKNAYRKCMKWSAWSGRTIGVWGEAPKSLTKWIIPIIPAHAAFQPWRAGYLRRLWMLTFIPRALPFQWQSNYRNAMNCNL